MVVIKYAFSYEIGGNCQQYVDYEEKVPCQLLVVPIALQREAVLCRCLLHWGGHFRGVVYCP